MKKTIITLVLILVSNGFTNLNVPSRVKKYEAIDISLFSWMLKEKKIILYVHLTKESESIISELEIERFIKLKMRNFVNNFKIYNKSSKENTKSSFTLDIEIDIHKYNQSLDIYYGAINFTLSNRSVFTNDFALTRTIAGSSLQITSFIKENLGAMVEKLAEDFYYIEDINDEYNKNKEVTKSPLKE